MGAMKRRPQMLQTVTLLTRLATSPPLVTSKVLQRALPSVTALRGHRVHVLCGACVRVATARWRPHVHATSCRFVLTISPCACARCPRCRISSTADLHQWRCASMSHCPQVRACVCARRRAQAETRVSVRARVRACCMRAFVCACFLRLRVCACVCACVRACVACVRACAGVLADFSCNLSSSFSSSLLPLPHPCPPTLCINPRPPPFPFPTTAKNTRVHDNGEEASGTVTAIAKLCECAQQPLYP